MRHALHDIAIALGEQSPGPTSRAPLEASPRGVTSLYIHVPFCYHKCHYCDFYSIVDRQDRQALFTDRLMRELRAIAPWAGGPLRTIFVGGGTPSLLRVELWESLLRELRESFDLSVIERAGGETTGEFTVECNPETVTPELAACLRAGGVNRVSMGAQSFDRRHLATLDRAHDPESVARALTMTRAAGIPRDSIDLIFGVPGQTMADWDRDLRAAISLGTSHISCYGLTYEPNTALTARRDRGDVVPIDHDVEADMFEATLGTLAKAGLARYEISNFAKPDQECQHNLVYWRCGQWLAAGPSASGHVGGWRWKNIPRLETYLARCDAGFAPVVDVESPDAKRSLRERVMMGLRLVEGVDWDRVVLDAQAASSGLGDRVGAVGGQVVDEGLAVLVGGRLRLTDRGLQLGDLVVRRLITVLA